MAQQGATNGSSEERDAARAAAMGCRRCGAGGLVMVFRPGYDGRRVMGLECVDRDGEIRPMPVAMVVAAHCECAMGRWMRANTEPGTCRRIPDLVDVLAGRSRWLAEDPTGDVPADVPRWRRELAARAGIGVGTRGR